MCKRDPPAPHPPEVYPNMLLEYERQYIFAGPIHLQNYTTEIPTDSSNSTDDDGPCKDVNYTVPRGKICLFYNMLLTLTDFSL